jgi:hypothetical protein
MSERDTTNDDTEEGTAQRAVTNMALAVRQEALEGAELFGAIAAEAALVRDEHKYDGALTAAILVALGHVLRRPTPSRYVQHIPATTGKPYDSTGLNSGQFQIDYMNAAFGRSHWRALRHYPAEHNGHLCKMLVIVGNDLVKAKLDTAGDLVAGDADILSVSEEWGSVKRAAAPADAYKGSATNASKRALAAFGPGSDVFRLEFEDENLGGVGDLTSPAQFRTDTLSGRSATATATPNRATSGMRTLIRRRAAAGGLDDGRLANIILRVAGGKPRDFASADDASALLERLFDALPRAVVEPTLAAIDSSRPAPNEAPTPTGAGGLVDPQRRAEANGVAYIGGSDVTVDEADDTRRQAA